MKTLKKYVKDWKWWFKLIVGIIPLLSIVIFFIGQSVDLLSDPARFWADDFAGRTDDFTPELMERVQSWTKGQNFGYLVGRNVFMYTTLANVALSTFLINSAVHHRLEGTGRFDSYKTGIIISSSIMWVIFFTMVL